MQHLSIRFLIGLAKPGDVPGFADRFPTVADARAATALDILSRAYPCLGSWRGVGYWRGAAEPSLTVETIVEVEDVERAPGTPTPDEAVDRAQTLAGEVARALGQDAVGVVVQPVSFTLEGPYATE